MGIHQTAFVNKLLMIFFPGRSTKNNYSFSNKNYFALLLYFWF